MKIKSKRTMLNMLSLQELEWAQKDDQADKIDRL